MGLICKEIQFLLCLGIFDLAFGFVRLNTTPAPPNDLLKGHLLNVSLHVLASDYLKSVYPDVMSLKISNSKFVKIDTYAFDYLTHLNLLEISNNEIQEQMDPQTFSRLSSLEILVLRNVGLRYVNLNLTHVQELVLAGNEIKTIDGDSIKGKDVNYLDLSNNKLRALTGSFANMSKLSIIDVSKNEIAEVLPVFKDNVNLNKICASQNRITSTEGMKLPWLKTLDLFSNRISALDSKSFSEMKSLEEVVLAINHISRVEDAFKDLIELKYLNLAWNLIEELRPELFRNNLYLTKLFLQGNKIKSLEKFQNVLYHLTHIDVSHNELALIKDDFFHSIPNIQALDLSFNHLKTIGNTMAPLKKLKILNLAFNELIMNGDELSVNHHLIRVNLSFNALQGGLTHFKNNRLLNDLDLSHNNIFHFCDEDVELKYLLKLNLKENSIKNLNCLQNLKSLCEIDLRKNPLSCGKELDALIKSFAERKSSFYKFVPEFQMDLLLNQCDNLSLNRSFDLWNSIKRELCPEGEDLQAEIGSKTREWESTEETDVLGRTEEPAAERFETKEGPALLKEETLHKKPHIFRTIDWIRKYELNNPNSILNPQSEKKSWENIEKKNPELLRGFEDEEAGKRPRFTWYTIALILIGLSLTLTCFNLFVFLYIKMKMWRRNETSSPQKYTVLHNEVYKNTTEPAKVYLTTERDWITESQTKTKIFTYGKINEFLLNFGLYSNNKDSESAKNILINSNANA